MLQEFKTYIFYQASDLTYKLENTELNLQHRESLAINCALKALYISAHPAALLYLSLESTFIKWLCKPFYHSPILHARNIIVIYYWVANDSWL